MLLKKSEYFKKWNKKILFFKFWHIFFLYFIITLRIIISIEFDNRDLYIKSTKPGYDNVSWIFTQFTWLTTILLAVVETLRFNIYIFSQKNNYRNRFLKFILSEEISILSVSYILVVGILFFAGMADILFVGRGVPKIKPFIPETLKVLDILNTLLVHAVNPIISLIFIILLSIRKYGYEIKLRRILIVGTIYPLIYIIFYTAFALKVYDPYPVTDLQNKWQGAWILPIVIFSFIFVETSIWFMVNKILIKEENKKV